MKTGNPFAKAAFAVGSIICFSAMSPQDAFADQGWRSLTGSWLVVVTPLETRPAPPPGQPLPPPFQNLATVIWDGTIITSDPIVGGGHGEWKRSGRRDFDLKFLALLPPVLPPNTLPSFLANATVTVTSSLTVSDRGDEADGTVLGEYSDSAGNILFSVFGAVSFTRIEVDRHRR